MLLPIASKVLGEILIHRIQGSVDHGPREEQAGFIPGRGTAEQIFILHNIMEQVDEWNATMYFYFVSIQLGAQRQPVENLESIIIGFQAS